MSPLDKLRYHVTGAIERGEAEAVVEVRQWTVKTVKEELPNVRLRVGKRNIVDARVQGVATMKRFHVLTTSAGVIINSESVTTLELAEARRAQRQLEILIANHQAEDRYAEQCRASVLETADSDDLIPELLHFDYVYKVEPCRIARKRCVSCLEMI